MLKHLFVLAFEAAIEVAAIALFIAALLFIAGMLVGADHGRLENDGYGTEGWSTHLGRIFLV